MSNKFIISHKKGDIYTNVTIRILKELLEEFDRLAVQSNRSRNELICMALQYAMDHLEFIPDNENQKKFLI
jgi:metal-responsive CopG/Arc/MetJ family transcriptional regulator